MGLGLNAFSADDFGTYVPLSKLLQQSPMKSRGFRVQPRAFGDISCTSIDHYNGLEIIDDLFLDVKNINIQEVCNNAKSPLISKNLRFNVSRCENVTACSQIKLSNVTDLEKRKKADAILRYLTAQDYAKKYLRAKAAEMEKLDVLKQFAQKKFDSKIGSNCASRFQLNNKPTCNISLVTSGFKDYQETCSSISPGCYSFEYPEKKIVSYKNFEKDYKGKDKPAMVAFFESRVDRRSARYAEVDVEYVDALSELVTSEKFKKATNDEKEDMFINAVKTGTGQSKYNYVDPVLSYEFNLLDSDNKSFKQNSSYKKLKDIFLKKNLSKEDFASNFDKFRKGRAEHLLGAGGECASVPSIESVCETASNINRGRIARVDMDGRELWDIIGDQSEKENRHWKVLKDLLGEEFANEKDLEVFLDSRRCKSFNIVGVEKGIIASLKADSEENGDQQVFDPESDSLRDVPRYSDGPDEMDDRTLASIGLGSEKVSLEDSAEIGKVSDDTYKAEDVVTSDGDHYNNPNNTFFNPNTFNNAIEDHSDRVDHTAVIPEIDSVKKEAEAIAAASPNDSRIAELLKKLSATEEKLDKLKASTEAAEEARIKEKRQQEEKDLIADLRTQINELKKTTAAKKAELPNYAPKAEVVQSAPSHSSSQGFSPRVSEAKSTYSAESDEPVRKAVDTSGATSAASSPSGPSRSIASAPVLTTNSAEGNDQSSGLTLTKVDGMTSEKAAETITNRILELNGIPFLIEEDGVTKKVIPLIKDGKIDLDEKGQPKYVKIKVNRKECTAEEKSAGKCRAPAAIATTKVNNSVADEKRDQEEKARREIERAQYMKLKALSEQALKKR